MLTLVEKIDKAILEQLDARDILSLPSANNPLATLHGKIFYLVSFVSDVGFGLK